MIGKNLYFYSLNYLNFDLDINAPTSPSSEMKLNSTLYVSENFMSLPSTKGLRNPCTSKGFVPYVSSWDYLDELNETCSVMTEAISDEDEKLLDLDVAAELQSLDLTIPINLTESQDYIVKLIENVLTFIRLVIKAEDTEDYVFAVTVFAQCRSNTSLIGGFTKKWNEIMNFGLQAGELRNSMGKLRQLLDKYDTVKKLPIFTKLYKFLLYCVGTSVFENLGIKFDSKKFLNVEKAVLKKEYHMGPDFMHCMLDTILYLCETGYDCMVSGSIQPLFHHESSYEQWIAEGEKLREQAKYVTNPEPHGFTVFDFLSRLDDNIEKGRAIVKFMVKGDPASMFIRRILSDLETIRADCKTKRLAQQERKAPFSVLVHGGSSVAKSQFTKMLFYHYGKLFNLPVDDEYKYTRNAFDQYWTNFNTSQWCIQLDDIAYLHPNKSSECGPSLVEMLQVVNNVPYVPTQADLADKGKTPVQSRFVIATSNTEHLNANTYFACPLAVQRRLPYVISIEPKPEYRRDGGPMIDPSKIPDSEEGSYPDLWYITIKRVVPSDGQSKTKMHMGQTADLVVINNFTNIYDFLVWFNEVAQAAENIQEKALKCDSDMRKVILCEHKIPKSKCENCSTVLQSDTAIVPVNYIQNQTPWMEEFYRRRATQDSEQNPPGWNYTMGAIYEEISKLNFLTRVIVYFYIWLLNFSLTNMKCAFIVSWFFGRWAWWIIACRLFHIPAFRHICVKVIGYQAYRRVRTSKAVIFCASIVTAVTIFKTSKLLYSMFTTLNKAPGKIERKLFMCYTSDCANCEVCLQRDKIYASNEKLPAWSESMLAKVVKNHTVLCSGDCTRCQSGDHKLQGEARERGEVPDAADDKQENIWYKDAFECTSFDVSESTLSKASWDVDTLAKYVSPNCACYIARVRIDDMIREFIGKTVCIGGHIYLFNNHSIPANSFELSLIFQSGKDGVTKNFTFLVSSNQIRRDPVRDVMFINIPNIPPRRNIMDLFVKESYQGRFDAEYLTRTSCGYLDRTPVKAPILVSEYNHYCGDLDVYIETPIWKGKVAEDTKKGDCGSLLITATAFGPILLGIHFAGGSDNVCFALRITQEYLRSQDFNMLSNAPPTLQVGEYKQELIDLNKKATVRYIEQGTLEVYGSLAGFRGKMKSRVQKTFMSDIAVRDGYQRKTAAPLMNSYIPWRKALLKIANPVSHIDQNLLDHCVEAFTKDVLARLDPVELKKVKVLDLDSAINGAPGIAYIDKMPRNTSAGFPFRKSKKYFLMKEPANDRHQHPVSITPEIEDEMDKIIRNYENGIVYCPVFTASLKDEPVSLKKVTSGKTRVFCGAPLPWSLVVRKYLLSFVRLVQKNRFIFESGPGTIAQSKEWHRYRDWETDRKSTRLNSSHRL